MKKTNIVLAIILFCVAINAQEKSEFSTYLGGGMSSLKYGTNVGDFKHGGGGMLGFGYTFFFTELLGAGTGVEFALYNSRISFDGHKVAEFPATAAGENFLFRSAVSDFEEHSRAVLLQVPLMLRLNFAGTQTHKFYAGVGGKIALPLGAKTRASSATLTNSAFFPEDNAEFTDLPHIGLSTYHSDSFEKKLDFRPTGFVSAEAGVKFKLKDGLSFFTGIYFDYGLKRLLDQRGRNFGNMVEYDSKNPNDFAISSVFDSFVEEVIPMAIGVKAGLSF